MTALSTIFLICCAAILGLSIRKDHDFLSPGRIMGFTWCLALGLADLKLSALQHTWDGFEWLMVVLGPASFLTGLFIAFVVNVDKPVLSLPEVRLRLRAQSINEPRLFLLICLGFALYMSAYVTIYLAKGFIPAFSPNAAALRKDFSVFGIGVLLNSMPFLLFFIFYYHKKVVGLRRRKHALKVIGAVAFVTYTLLLQRFQIVMAAVMCFAMFYYLAQRIKIRTLVATASGLVLFFYYISTLRAGQLISYYLYASSRMKFSYHYALFTEPYMYLVMNLENLARSTARLESYTFGLYTFDFMFAVSGLKHWLAEYLRLDETPFLVSGYNTYTAFWTFFRDFGPFGLTILPLGLGTLIGCTYYGLRRTPSLQLLTAYAVMIFVMVFSFFNSPMGFLWFAYNAFFMILIVRLVAGKTEPSFGAPPAHGGLAP
jgi:oligosaccharide repeat unit polymerase